MTTPSKEDRELLQRLEEELWREETRFDRHRMDKVFAEDFFEFGRSGRCYPREDTLDAKPQPIAPVLPLPNLNIRLLTPDVAQVTYNSAVTYHGVVEHARRSSIWTRTRSGWQLRFHQGTPFNEKA